MPVGLILVPCMVLPTIPTALISDRAAQLMTDAERQQFYLTAFAGGPLALLGGSFFRVINGRERDGFAADPVVRRLGGEEKVRAARRRLRKEGFSVLFDPSLFR